VTVLARVTGDLDEPRGPDVSYTVDVPAEWLEQGASIEVTLPRLLPCTRCAGGGCDVCARKGAFEQPASGIPSQVVVSLPRQPSGASAALCLRLPESGARHATEPDLPAGHLLLTIVPHEPVLGDSAQAWAPASSIRLLEPAPALENATARDPMAENLDEQLRRWAARIRRAAAWARSLRHWLAQGGSRLARMWALGVALISLLAWWLST
jgi:hypothetical protein